MATLFGFSPAFLTAWASTCSDRTVKNRRFLFLCYNDIDRFIPAVRFSKGTHTMSAQSPSSAKAQVEAHLHALSHLLREARRLGPEEQALLADFVDELGNALASPDVPDEEVATLTASASGLLQAVHEQHEPGMLEAAEDRLESAAVTVEAKAPGLANLTRRLAEMLSDLGI